MNEGQQYPAAFVKNLLSSLNSSTWILGLTLATGASLLPVAFLSGKGIARYGVSCCGLAATVAALKTKAERDRLLETTADMQLVERKQLMSWYNRHLGSAATVSIIAPPTPAAAPRADLVDYWKQQDKHMLVVAGTGAGKSTFIQAFCSHLGNGWAYQIYDRDCTVDDWGSIRNLPTTRLYESYKAIEDQMSADLSVLEARTEERKHQGNRWQTTPTFTIAEEMPALVGEVEDAGVWFGAHAKRGRRVKRYVCAVSQNDTVDNLGLRGDAALINSCFVRVYLGKEAVARAKHIKNEPMAAQLKEGGYALCLVDDMVFQRPQPGHTAGTFEFANSAENVNELTPEPAGTESQSDFQLTNPANRNEPNEVKTADNDTLVREFVGSCLGRLSPYGQQLLTQLLPVNKVGATSDVGLVYWLMMRQKQQPKLKALLFECFGNNGSLYSDMSNLYKELASTGVFNQPQPE